MMKRMTMIVMKRISILSRNYVSIFKKNYMKLVWVLNVLVLGMHVGSHKP